MNRVSSKWLLITLALCSVVLVAAVSNSRYQGYRVSKIEFIIWDNQHENVANLSREKFTEYIQLCGGRIDSSTQEWTVRYDGFFLHRSWAFPFVPPSKETSR